MGCTIHHIANVGLKNHMIFFREVTPPHTAINVQNQFEDELDRCAIQYFLVGSDNSTNKKCAFTIDDDMGDEDFDNI